MSFEVPSIHDLYNILLKHVDNSNGKPQYFQRIVWICGGCMRFQVSYSTLGGLSRAQGAAYNILARRKTPHLQSLQSDQRSIHR